MKKLGYIVTTIIIVVLCTLWNGIALSTVWNWLVPELFGLGALTTFEAIVISFFASYLCRERKVTSEEEEPYSMQLIKAVSTGITYPLVFIATGWVLTWFI